jgi:hypothetical protein
MVEGRFIARGVVATLLSPVLAGFAAALAFTIIIFIFLPEGGESTEGTAGNFFNITLYLWLAAAFFGAPFTIVAALLSQIPLAIFHRWRGRRALVMHLAASAVLGVLLFWLLSPILTPFRNTGPVKWEDLWSLSVAVAAGGVSVGLLWDWLVLKPMFKGG